MGKIIKTVMTRDEFVKEIVSDEYINMTFVGARILFDHLEHVADHMEEDTEFSIDTIRSKYCEKKLSQVLYYYDKKDFYDLQDACGFASKYENAAGEVMVVYNREFQNKGTI